MSSFKKDDKSSRSNYRPISLFSCVGKVMERVVYKYIYNYLDLRFKGEPIEVVKNHKHFGITLALDGNWTNHIDNIVSASLKQVNVLRKLKCTLSKQTLSNIFLTFIRPTLEYACEVWDGCFEQLIYFWCLTPLSAIFQLYHGDQF